MANQPHDLTGRVFGSLTVVERAGSRCRQAVWRCLCACGKETIAAGSNLRAGRSISCGCYRAGRLGEMSRVHGEGSAKAGTETAEHRIWAGMLSRCRNQSNPAFGNYGGRGISVCPQWTDYAKFLADVGRRPSSAHTLDRRDNAGNYEPGNVRWATRAEQANNRRSNVMVKFGGQIMPLKAAAEKAGIPYKTVHARIRRHGWPAKRALSVPVG